MPQPTTISVDTLTPKIRNVTFCNPPVSLVGQETVRRLLEVVEDLRQDKQVQVVIFTSSTPGYFFNHVGLGQIAEFQALPSRDSTPAWVDLMVRVSTAPFISIASIRGRTRGDGNELTLACDLRYASREHALFCQPEVACGLVPGGGGTERLPRVLGRDRALEAILSSYDHDAEQAERYGWVTRAIADAELDDSVDGLASRIASFDRTAVAAAKAQINRASLPPVADLKASYGEFSESVTWRGFQDRMPRFGELIAQKWVSTTSSSTWATTSASRTSERRSTSSTCGTDHRVRRHPGRCWCVGEWRNW